MATLQPLYRFTVFAPRSEDPTETAVLAPIAGAAHTDPFVVATLQGIAGAKPYLGFPKGRTGSLDPITKKLTIGNLSLPLLDPRITPGGSNLVRWVTAFVGDTLGRARLKGCKFTLERSLDGTAASLAPFFAGRIKDVAMDAALWITFDLKDYADDLNRDVFVASPDPTLTYAQGATIFPVGLSRPYGPFPTVPPMRGTFRGGGFLDADLSQPDSLCIITQVESPTTLTATQKIVRTVNVASGAVGYYLWIREGAILPIASTGGTQHYRYQWFNLAQLPTVDGIGTVSCAGGAATFSTSQAGVVQNGATIVVAGVAYMVSAFNGTTGCTLSGAPTFSATDFALSTDPRFSLLPAAGTAVTFTITRDGPPTPSLPILLDSVHPVQHIADVLDGKFSRRPGDTTTRALVARDVTPGGPWDLLIQDGSFGTIRMPVPGSAKANAWLEQLCQSLNIGIRFDASGKVVPVDLRRTAATLTTALLLTDADLVTDVEPAWSDSRDGAITAVDYTYYVERQVTSYELAASTERYPPYPATLLVAEASEYLVLNDLSTLRDVGEKIVKINGLGARTVSGDTTALQQQILAAMQEFLRPYGSGTLKARATYRLMSANIASIFPGSVRLVQHTKLPDPSTNVRGGTRLMLCLSRQDADGRGVAIEWLDCGANTVAVVPAITGLSSPSRTVVNVALTLNAATDPADVWFCLTPSTTAVRPDDADSRWMRVGGLVAAGTLAATSLPSGQRVWARARSIGGGSILAQPSAWVYAGGTGYVDLAPLVAPPALNVTTPTGDVAHLAWANGEPTLGIEVLLVAGSTPASWLDAYQLGAALTAGTIATDVTGLTLGATYSVGIRHRDPVTGAASAVTSSTFTAGAVPAVLTAPLSATGYSSGRWSYGAGGHSVAPATITFGLAVQATVLPGQVEFRLAKESAPGSGAYGAYSPIATVDAVSADWTSCRIFGAADGCRCRLSARSVSGSATSAWTVDVEFDPSIRLALSGFQTLLGGLSDLEWSTSGGVTTITFSSAPPTAEVWGAYQVVPGSASPNFAVLAALIAPLAPGATSYAVPAPPDGYITIVQLEPRHADLSVGIVRRVTITAASQVPHIEVDDRETNTTGTQWWKITERGIPVTTVEVQTQIGIAPVSAWSAPTRSGGAASTVRGGVLGTGEYEHDVPLDPSRQSWIMPRLTLANGSSPIVLGPFGFDRDKNPNLAAPVVVGDRKLSVLGDVDTKSMQVFEGEYPWAAGRWMASFDGASGVVDLAATDVNGVAGLGSAATKLYTVVAYAAASGYVDGTTPFDKRTITVAGATAPAPAGAWDTVFAVAPLAPTSGTGADTVTLQLKATAAPAGWAVKVYYGADLIGGTPDPTTDITSWMSPAPSPVPTTLTSYTYGTGYPATRSIGSQHVTARFRVDLVNGSGVVQDTRTVQANWNTTP